MQAEGLSALVEYNNKKAIEVHQEELKLSLSEMIMTDPPMTVKECIDHVKTRKSEWQLPDVEVVKVCFYLGPVSLYGSTGIWAEWEPTFLSFLLNG